jgi:hypothetical protein
MAHVGVVCGRQLEARWVLSEPTIGMTDLLGHAVANNDSFWPLMHMLVCDRLLVPLWVLF